MQLSRMLNNQALRGAMDGLTTLSRFSIFSTCILLLAQIQIFHALPTPESSSLSNSELSSSSFSNSPGNSPSSAYGTAYPYRSYRAGSRLESYRPYSPYQKELQSQNGLYNSESVHPNSVYSRQSTTSVSSQDLEKVLKYIEKEIESEIPRERKEIPSSLPDPIPSEKNKPRLAPLVPVAQIEKQSEKLGKPAGISSPSIEPSVDPIHPPPFAPELDPEFERRQYGLGSLTLLDQAGPFW